MYYQLQNSLAITADATGTVTVNKDPINRSRNPNDPYLDKHCITINQGTSTAGTITITTTAIGGKDAEPVFESGVAKVVNLATSGEPFTIWLEGVPVENFIFAGASMNGTTWSVTIISGY